MLEDRGHCKNFGHRSFTVRQGCNTLVDIAAQAFASLEIARKLTGYGLGNFLTQH